MRHLPQHRVMHYPLRCPLHRSSLTRQRGSLPCSDHRGSHSTCALCTYEASLPVNNNCSGISITIFGQLLMDHQATSNIMPVLVGTYKSASYQVNRSIHVGGGFSDTECGALQRSHDLGSVAILNLRQKFRKMDGWQCCIHTIPKTCRGQEIIRSKYIRAPSPVKDINYLQLIIHSIYLPLDSC